MTVRELMAILEDCPTMAEVVCWAPGDTTVGIYELTSSAIEAFYDHDVNTVMIRLEE